jgi:hypothetical protein
LNNAMHCHYQAGQVPGLQELAMGGENSWTMIAIDIKKERKREAEITYNTQTARDVCPAPQ